MIRLILYAMLAMYLVLACLYSIVTPPFEASDELWHYPMVKYLADHGLQLPLQDPVNPGPWRQEGSQPPLYYILSAILTAGIDTSDMDEVRRQNPHADIGVVRPDGNMNMIVHHTETEVFPWHGTVLAVHVIRFFSVALGLGTVIVTYQLAKEVFPEQPLVALGAAALNAFLPMFLFISGSVNNDNLSNLLGNLLTLLIVRLVKTQTLPNWKFYTLIGVVAGGGLLAKLNIGFLIPLVVMGLLTVSWRFRSWQPVVIGGIISSGLTIMIAGWWYLRNAQLYGDPTGLGMFLQMVGRRAVPANAAQLWSERHSFTQAYWGFFGGVNVPLPDIVYQLFNVLGGIGLMGSATFIIHSLVKRAWTREHWLPAAVTLIWPVVTFISFLRWTAETPASQGRLIYGALSAVSVWMAAGLVWWLPRRLKLYALTGVAGYFLVVAVLAPFLIIAPTYALPASTPTVDSTTRFVEPDGRGEISIANPRLLNDQVTPESYLHIEMELSIVQQLNHNWSLFVHLVNPEGVIVAQRDIYPGQGKLATSDLAQGRSWLNSLAIWIPNTAYAPMRLDVVMGWYDLQTGKRLVLASGEETLMIGQINLLPRTDDLGVPNPIRINFDNQIELVGYSLSDLSPSGGESPMLTLYWRGIRPIDVDYKVFANILDLRTLAKYASSDAMPVNWQSPTSTWEPGVIIEDTHILSVDPNAPPGIYELQVGLYAQAVDSALTRLRIVTPDGGMASDVLYLSRVRIVPEDNS
jgi:4-amino-4-deoxy-L-arabinose transferase-like glycosyltransferase